MSPAQMRAAILKVYPLWKDKLATKSDKQIYAIYMRLLNQKKLVK